MSRRKKSLKKHIPVILFGLIGYAFFVYLAILMAPYFKHGLFRLIFAPYKPFLQIEWVGMYDLYSIIFFSIGYIMLVMLLYIKSRRVRPGEEHGSMKWSDTDRLNKDYSNKNEFMNRIVSDGLRLNEDMQTIRRTLNMIVEGGPGTGKSRGFVIPNILQLVGSGSSAMVVDPKGELLANTGELLREHGVRVKVFDVKDMDKSHHYNPFNYIHSVEDAIKVVDMIWSSTLGENKSEGNDPFWPGAARAGFLAYVLYIWSFAPYEEQNFETVFYMFENDAPPKNPKEQSPISVLFNDVRKNEPNHPAIFWYDTMHSGTDDMQLSVRAIFSERLKYFTLPSVIDLTRNDELALNELTDEQTVLFCITPITNKSFNFLVSLLFMQLIDELYLTADRRYHSKLPRHFHFLIDEFYKFKVDQENFQGFLSTNRGYNISCTMIIQAYSQLEEGYKKEGAAAIQAYCDSYLFLGSNSIESTEHVAKILGNETINTTTYGYQHGGKGGTSSNHQQSKRELLDANELRILNNGKLVYFLRGEYPVFDDKYDLYNHPYSNELGEVKKKYYDHGAVKNDLQIDAYSTRDSVVYRFDMSIKGTAAKNIRYVTDKEIEMFGN